MLSFDPPWAVRDLFPELCGPECLLFPAWRWGSWPGPRCAGCLLRAGDQSRSGLGPWESVQQHQSREWELVHTELGTGTAEEGSAP